MNSLYFGRTRNFCNTHHSSVKTSRETLLPADAASVSHHYDAWTMRAEACRSINRVNSATIVKTTVLKTLGGAITGVFLRRMSTLATDFVSGMHSVAYVTAPSEEVAKKLAQGIVLNKLAACVNIIPKITSIYEWKGEINEDSEVLMMIKTRTTKVGELSQYVKSNHPYEVCEVISVPIVNGNPDYLKWISDTVPQ